MALLNQGTRKRPQERIPDGFIMVVKSIPFMTAQRKRADRPAHRVRRDLVDGCGRRIDHLRLSVTSRCDLRCVYCRPDLHVNPPNEPAALTDDQRVELVRFLHERFGLAQVRITGGEPLVYDNLVPLIASIREAMPDLKIAMTTNARLLPLRAKALRRAGLERLNISLDSLRPDRYREITGSHLAEVLAGFEAARDAGFPAPKVNVVALRGINDDEFAELAEWGFARGSEVRFLEAMPIGPVADFNRKAYMPNSAVRSRLGEHFALEPLTDPAGSTARHWFASNDTCRGVIGLISPVSEPFCGGCRRIRVTATGGLYPCLLDSRSSDLSVSWRNGLFDEELAERIILQAVGGKAPQGTIQSTPMINIGG